MSFDFVKSHGLGNDYLVIDPSTLDFELTPVRAVRICDRHTGVGSDGILLVEPDTVAEFALRILNPDGSEAEKSGNGLRIFAKFLYEHGYTRKTEFSIRTAGGFVRAKLFLDEDRVTSVRVEMGRATIDPQVTSLILGDEDREAVALSVGNPHCVLIVPDIDAEDRFRIGPLVENHPAFPNRTNVQLAQVLSRDSVRAWIWERGAGHTQASGSSACAVAAACYSRRLVDGTVMVRMEGGDLKIEIDPDLSLIMTGPVEEICTGSFSPDLRQRLTSL